MKFYLQTERLILRELQESDLEGMFELDSNPEVHKYLGNKPITTRKQAKDNIAFIKEQYKKRGVGRFACIEKVSGDFIGWSGLKLNQGKKESLNGFTNFIDIGYRFIPRYWNKGYASESAFACLDFGFNKLHYDIIYGAADVANIGSNKVLQKIGLEFVNEFVHEGVDVNWYELKRTGYER
ncbi:GNAT family N-acetyltransferase [Tenacibaculum tangerinum]|uniref:GNAT family N-acetyltransferase n=1 Tax=Tenacibaculum tangerinum TaxID=3038772 RepID=A0ABY8L0X6_9FLAO|nr:GNAT family N-acetyltransferase [Tenacibaculum tangerinum]WGH74944.1 GNAT family N-acetyltransferase [Tenacibaculum tangerinum]